MAKINLRTTLISEDENFDLKLTGIKANNKIIYRENNITVTILIFDNKIEMNRSCSEYNVNLIFENNKKTISTYSIFGGTKIFELETKTKKFKSTENEIKIEYELEGNNFSYSLIIGG